MLLRHLGRPRRFRARVRRIARAHGETLALRRRQESFCDAYGNRIEDGWLREREYFLDRTVLPQIGPRYADLAVSERERMLAIVEAEAAAVALPDEEEAPGDGLDYERFCAERLAGPAGGRTGRRRAAIRAPTSWRCVTACASWSSASG